VFGLLPLVQARRTDVQTALRADDRRSAAGGRDSQRLRSTLVVVEVALAVVLVTSAGLLIRSFWHLSKTDPGFDVNGVLKAEFQPSPVRYPGRGPVGAPNYPAYIALVDTVLERVSRLPGVEAAGIAANHPLDTGYTQGFRVVGREAEGENWPEISVRHVTPGYFKALRVPLVRGRFIEARDTVTAPPVVMLNQATVDRFFPGQDPIGHQIAFWGTRWTVVGIVANERFHGVANAAPIAAYAPLAQTRLGTLALVVKTTGEPESMASTVRSVIREIDPQLAVFGIEPLEETLANTLGEPRFMMQLLVLFAVLAAVLAAVGVHGVLTYVVAQRTREIGVRVTLGATAGGVTRLVVGQGLRLVLIGLAGGLAMTLVLTRGLAGLLFGVSALDPATLVTVVGVFGLVAAVSIWLPARRAVRLDPLVALRQD